MNFESLILHEKKYASELGFLLSETVCNDLAEL